MTNNDSILKNKNYWDQEWDNIFDHYQNDIRHAYYLRAIKRKDEKKLLEIAAGSFRDMATLCKWGIYCEGIDFSDESVNKAKFLFPDLKERIHTMDAFNLKYDDNYFDLTYHNGFWGYFSDEEIIKLAKEQARVTKYRMIATVHNAHNISFKKYFEKLQQTDPLYSLRFFHIEEIKSIMSEVCSKVTIIPVGKGKKHHEDKMINLGFGYPTLLDLYFKYSGYRFLEQSERLLCIGEL